MKGKCVYRSVCVAGFAFAASAWALPPTAEVDLDAIQAQSDTTVAAAPADPVEAKIHSQLRGALDAQARGTTTPLASLPAALHRDGSVLVEVHLRDDETDSAALDVFIRHGAVRRNRLSNALHEVWIPLDRLRELAVDSDVAFVTPARLVEHVIGSKTSEGVAAGNANLWQNFTPAYDGTGIKIAMIDSYQKSSIASLQTSKDWPATAKISCFDLKGTAQAGTDPPYNPVSCTSSTFGSENVTHGNGTLEIAYDVAPGATFLAYDTETVGDWYNAILDAAHLSAAGATLGAVKANVISASLAAPLDGKGDGVTLPGTIAEAAGFAKARGVLVVNAAGNERQNHWGGLFSPQVGNTGFHSWTGNNTQFNPFGPSTSQVYCYATGKEIYVQMYWNNWVTNGSGQFVANHNYDLYLYQLSSTGTWVNVASSVNLQNGGVDQTPQEFIQYTTTGGTSSNCATNMTAYAVAVVRVVGTTTADNLQVFASTSAGGELEYNVPARSLDFPADSPNVLSVAAIDVKNATTNPQEPFSSQGPVLAAGGGLPVNPNPLTDTNLKPDLASFDDVTTVSITDFFGTSASTPHAAGMAALFMQKFGVQTTAANLIAKIITPLQTIASTGANDLGTVGKDYSYGYGRLKFQQDAGFTFTQQPTNTVAGATITPAVKVQVVDIAAKPDLFTLYTDVTLTLGTNPGGGTLIGGGSTPLTAGAATFSTLKIDMAGTGYTLKATSTPPGLTSTSSAFNITAGTATHIAFIVQPSNVAAGDPIAPTVQVAIEDANGNVVTAKTGSITLRKSTCTSLIPDGGGPIAVVNGVASFPALTLNTVANGVVLQASSTGFATINSNPFNVTGGDTIFANGFEAGCVP
jgi:Subtilase family